MRLGKTQRSVLESLVSHGKWHLMCGWVWDNHYGTRRIMDQLVSKGLAIATKAKPYRDSSVTSSIYKPTPEGIRVAKEKKQKPRPETARDEPV